MIETLGKTHPNGSLNFHLTSLKLTASLPLKRGRNPKGKDHLPNIHLQVLCYLYNLVVSGRVWFRDFRDIPPKTSLLVLRSLPFCTSYSCDCVFFLGNFCRVSWQSTFLLVRLFGLVKKNADRVHGDFFDE